MSATLEALARRYCEHSTTIQGCFGAHPEPDPCPPCMARQELGLPMPRHCDECGADVTATGTDSGGGTHCAPKSHRPHRFYHERAKVAR